MNTKLGYNVATELSKHAAANHRIWVLDGDLADSEGAEIFQKQFPNRYLPCGIAEQNMITMASGMAAIDLIPWVFSFACFLVYQAYNQIRTSISQTNLPVKLVGSHAGACGGRNGKTHITLNDIALMRTLPNIEIWAPGDNNDVKTAVMASLQSNRPCYIRLPRDPVVSLPSSQNNLYWIGQPTELALISYGYTTHWAQEARSLLEAQGYFVSILHFNKIWPLDKNVVLDQLQNVKQAIVIEDHYMTGGLYSILKEMNIACILDVLSWPTTWSGKSGNTNELREFFGLDGKTIAECILKRRQL